ncbi:hypothetical protein CI610_00915 [invertebrate metagenome]|uniref:Uncharacterized protein n=1 Tax=invertebrate metagenome TaxID=1711999 RepID=A0A2H9TA83_9ZZZZ
MSWGSLVVKSASLIIGFIGVCFSQQGLCAEFQVHGMKIEILLQNQLSEYGVDGLRSMNKAVSLVLWERCIETNYRLYHKQLIYLNVLPDEQNKLSEWCWSAVLDEINKTSNTSGKTPLILTGLIGVALRDNESASLEMTPICVSALLDIIRQEYKNARAASVHWLLNSRHFSGALLAKAEHTNRE